jgi:hypothetical protein
MVVCMILLHLRKERTLDDFSESSARRYFGVWLGIKFKSIPHPVNKREDKVLFLIPIYNAIYAERINMHQDCVLTVIKLFAKTVKYEYCMKVY